MVTKPGANFLEGWNEGRVRNKQWDLTHHYQTVLVKHCGTRWELREEFCCNLDKEGCNDPYLLLFHEPWNISSEELVFLDGCPSVLVHIAGHEFKCLVLAGSRSPTIAVISTRQYK